MSLNINPLNIGCRRLSNRRRCRSGWRCQTGRLQAQIQWHPEIAKPYSSEKLESAWKLIGYRRRPVPAVVL